jgi:hypothetical protein
MYASTSSENDRQRLTLDLHRLTISAKRPDRSGFWQINLNLIAPVAEIKEIKDITAAPRTKPAPAKVPKPQNQFEAAGCNHYCQRVYTLKNTPSGRFLMAQ